MLGRISLGSTVLIFIFAGFNLLLSFSSFYFFISLLSCVETVFNHSVVSFQCICCESQF